MTAGLDPEFLFDGENDITGDIDAELLAGESLFHDELAHLFRVPTDLLDRTRVDVQTTLLGRSTLLAAVDLLGSGWHTARLLFGSSSAADPSEEEEEST